MFQRPPPFGVLPLNQRESFSYSAFLKNKNLLHPHHPRLKNGAPNYVLPKSFLPSVVWMTKW